MPKDSVEFSNNDFTGPLPLSLSLVPLSDTLAFEKNRLTGTIPTEYGRLRGLKEFTMSDNQLVGSIPSQLGFLTQLSTSLWEPMRLALSPFMPILLARRVKLSFILYALTPVPLGIRTIVLLTIDRFLFHLLTANTLSLARNQLTGTVPSELGRLSLLRTCICTFVHFGEDALGCFWFVVP